MKRETYPEARLRLFRELSALDYKVKVTDARTMKSLKVPQVIVHGLYQGVQGNDTRTLYFHAQAVYLDDLSTGLDIRGMSADTLMAIVVKIHESRQEIGR